MSPDLTFFDTAAALIPVLLLGGAITERLRPREADSPRPPLWQWLFIILAFFFFPASAEVFAISAALSDDPSTFAVWWVATAITFGTWSLAAAVTWPWLRYMWRESRFSRVAFALSIAILTGMSAQLLATSVNIESLRAEIAQDPPSLTGATQAFVDAEVDVIRAERAMGRLSSRDAATRLLAIARARRKLALYELKDATSSKPRQSSE